MIFLISTYRLKEIPFCRRSSFKTAANSFRIIDFPMSINSPNKDL